MKTSITAPIAATLFCWIAVVGTTSAVAQAYYYYYGPPFNAWVRLPLAGEPPFIPWGRAYYDDSSCYPSVGVCCPPGFKLVHTEQRQLARVTKHVCTPIG